MLAVYKVSVRHSVFHCRHNVQAHLQEPLVEDIPLNVERDKEGKFYTKSGEEVSSKADLVTHNNAYDIDQAEERARSMKLRGRVSGLCGRCSHSTIIVRSSLNDPTVLCSAWMINRDRPRQVPGDIVSCTSYQREGTVSVEQLIQISKPMDLGQETKKVGFIVTSSEGDKQVEESDPKRPA